MASPPIKHLHVHGRYLCWKESLLLRAHTLGVARVLFDARPANDGDEAAAKKWARDDAVCRGHILAALSDRLLPDYARFATAVDLWRALERTYDSTTCRWSPTRTSSSASSPSMKAQARSSWSSSCTPRLWAPSPGGPMTSWLTRCAGSFRGQ
ncbi:unnamed protein product [Urochloa humidicola]